MSNSQKAFLSGSSKSTSSVSVFLRSVERTSINSYLNGYVDINAFQADSFNNTAFQVGNYCKSSASTYLSGNNIGTSSTLAYLRGYDPHSRQHIYISGKGIDIAGISCFATGNLYIASQVPAFMDGIAESTSSVQAFLSGKIPDSSIPAYLNGVIRSSKPVYIEGQPGVATTFIPVYLFGNVGGNTSVFITGKVEEISFVSAYVCNMLGETKANQYAYISGINRDSTPSFVNGLIKRVDYIWLKTSDNGETLSKKFLVLKQDYDDGTMEKSEALKKTISGGLSKDVGEVYTSWSMIIRVRAEESKVNYGDRDDLEYFWKLNNPNATPSNLITFIDHRGYEYKVHIKGNMKKNLMTVAVEGTEAIYFYRLELIKVNSV